MITQAFIHKYFLNTYYVSGIILRARNLVVNKT